MASHIERRKFLATLVGGAAAWPLAARAQQAERMRHVAFLHPYTDNDPEVLARIVAFRQGLEALGWTENRNIRIEHRYSGGDLGQIQAYATELVRSAPDLIVGSGTPITAALKQATDTIPIVFNVVNDPVGQGFVATLSHPGGNITGFTFMDFPLIGKWLEMLKEIAPDVRRMTLMFNPDSAPFYPVFLREFGAAPASLAVELSASPVHNEAEIETGITAFAREPRGGLLVAPDAFINTRRHLIMEFAKQHRLPAIYGFRQFVTEGALMCPMDPTPPILSGVRPPTSIVFSRAKGRPPCRCRRRLSTIWSLISKQRTRSASLRHRHCSPAPTR
jgi:ABC-type uncharacterized transport system substrate-binding protein